MTFRQGLWIGSIVTWIVVGFIINTRYINRDVLQLNKFFLNGKFYKLVEIK